MASSLSPACNPAKQAYDTCFNSWLKSYLLLVSPPFSSPASTKQGEQERHKRDEQIRAAKQRYESECGEQYKAYQACLRREIDGKEGLSEMLEQARREEPLDGWGGIKVATEDDLKG